MDAMSTEIDRIAGTTTWAGANLMEAATTGFSFQVGAATGTKNQISVDIKSMNTVGLGLDGGTAGVTGVPAASEKFTQPAYTVTAAMFSNATDITNIAGLADDGTTPDATRSQSNVMATITSDVDIKLTDAAGNVTTISLKANDDAGNITALSAVSGVVAAQADTAQAVTGSQGTGIKLTFAADSAAAVVAADAVEGVTQVAANINRVSVEDTTTGAGDADDNALAGIVLIDAAIKKVNVQRSELGAVSNRLNHTVNNLTNISSNLSAAKGGIEDADFALETTNLAKNQILQQASTAMLAQANASQQNVLALLRI
jgi:flagellin